MADASAPAPTGNWHDAFPAPRHSAPLIPRETVLSDISSPELLLVDVRRTDFEGGTIRGSLNLPAHSFYFNRAVLYDLCKRAGVKQVAFYCGTYRDPGPFFYLLIDCLVRGGAARPPCWRWAGLGWVGPPRYMAYRPRTYDRHVTSCPYSGLS